MEWPKEESMRVFWWQGGLQIQPENPVETEAILVLLDGLKYEPPPERDGARTSGCGAASLDQAEGDLDIRL
jgi:hypothetical protein